MFHFFTAIALILGLTFVTYGKSPVLGTVSDKAHRLTDDMLDAITDVERTK